MPSLISQMRQNGMVPTQITMQQQQSQQLQMQPQLSQNDAILSQIRNMANTMRTVQNPEAIQNVIMSNPNLKQAMNLLQMSGNNPMQVIISLAKQRGINPTAIIQAIQGK